MRTDLEQAVEGVSVSSSQPAIRRRATSIGEHLRSIVLLGGAVRQSDLSRSISRSVLDLPVRDGLTLLDHWREQAEALAQVEELHELPLRVMIDRTSIAPRPAADNGLVRTSIESDAADLRGTGGLLRDLSMGYQPEDVVLVVNACQVLLEPLTDLYAALAEANGDINLIAHEDGTPVGVMLLSCRALQGIKDKGYIDFKEQALPELAKRFDVRVVTRSEPTAKPIRTLGTYLTALWMAHRAAAGLTTVADPFFEDWSDNFAIIEPGAVVEPSARIHDSVVLSGARVGAGATLVRSVVCPGAVVRAGDVIGDRIVTGRTGKDRIFRR